MGECSVADQVRLRQEWQPSLGLPPAADVADKGFRRFFLIFLIDDLRVSLPDVKHQCGIGEWLSAVVAVLPAMGAGQKGLR
jgi:hypothetical protein